MVQALYIKGRESIDSIANLKGKDKVSVNGKSIDIKEIPIIRVSANIENNADALFNVIKTIKETFRYSAVTLEGTLEAFSEEILNKCHSEAAIFVHLDKKNLTNEEIVSKIEQLSNSRTIYKWIITDNKSELMIDDVRNIKSIFNKQLKQKVGFCGTPFSMGADGCMTAENAREIYSLFTECNEASIPCAGHEVGNTDKDVNMCTCFRFTVVNEICAVLEKEKHVIKKEKSDNKERAVKSNSKAIQFGRFSL